MNDQLKPCPFCDSAEIYLRNDDHHHMYFVQCDECGCRTDYCEYRHEAINDWNRRPEDEY